jgi:small subunit ribosomal protein S8
MMTDPIADMITRLRNAQLARHDRCEMPHSKLKQHLAEVLKGEGYVDDVRSSEGEGQKVLTVVLRYGRDKTPAMDGIKRVSTPGRRVYVRHDRIGKVCSGMGVSILSTSHGVMTDKEAKKQRVGGELLCEVW